MKFSVLALMPCALSIANAYTGDMTYYETGKPPIHPPSHVSASATDLSNPGLGSCGYTSQDSDAIVALSVQMMNNPANPNNNPLCGTYITITNPATGNTAQAEIVDTCQGCADDDIDVSPSVFEAVDPNGLGDGRITVDWTM